MAALAVPPPIPGEPIDVMVAITAAANTMGVPPAVAVSTLAAAKTGDKNAKRELGAAKAVYEAARKGDAIAMAQMSKAQEAAKTGDPEALRKLAFLAAATGSVKGWENFKSRKGGEVKAIEKRVKAAVVADKRAELAAQDRRCRAWINFGVGPGWPGFRIG